MPTGDDSGRPPSLPARWLDALVGFVDRRPGVAALVLFLLNVALKLPTVGAQSLWLDEAATIHFSLPPIDFQRYLTVDSSPFYYVLFTPWMRIFGTSAVSARIPSVLLSAATAPLLLLFARRFFDTRTGLFAAALFTVSRFQFYFAQEARSYALVGLLMVVSFHLFLSVLESRGRRRAAALAVVNALAMYTHYVAVFGFMAQLVAALILCRGRPDRLRRYVVSQVLAAALFIPFLVSALLTWPPPHSGWIPAPKLGDLRYILKQFTGGTHLLIVNAVVLIGLGLFFRARREPSGACSVRRRPSLLLVWAFFPIVAPWALSYLYPIFFPRYVLYASLGLYLLVGFVIAASRLSTSAQMIVVSALCLWTLGETLTNPHQRPDWRGAMERVRSLETPGSRIVLSPHFQHIPFAYYYAPARFLDYDHTEEGLAQDGVIVIEDVRDLAGREGWKNGRVIAVVHEWAPFPPDQLPEWMEAQGMRLVQSENFESVRVLVFEPATG